MADSYYLMIDKDAKTLTGAKFPDDLWLSILRGFLAKEANRIAFDVLKAADIEKIKLFEETKPKYIANCMLNYYYTRMSDNKLIQRGRHPLAIFQYDESIQKLIESMNFDYLYWDDMEDEYPSQKLFFFKDDILLLDTDSSESSILLPNLSEAQLESLKNLDPRIAPNLHKTSEQKVVISWIDPS